MNIFQLRKIALQKALKKTNPNSIFAKMHPIEQMEMVKDAYKPSMSDDQLFQAIAKRVIGNKNNEYSEYDRLIQPNKALEAEADKILEKSGFFNKSDDIMDKSKQISIEKEIDDFDEETSDDLLDALIYKEKYSPTDENYGDIFGSFDKTTDELVKAYEQRAIARMEADKNFRIFDHPDYILGRMSVSKNPKTGKYHGIVYDNGIRKIRKKDYIPQQHRAKGGHTLYNELYENMDNPKFDDYSPYAGSDEYIPTNKQVFMREGKGPYKRIH